MSVPLLATALQYTIYDLYFGGLRSMHIQPFLSHASQSWRTCALSTPANTCPYKAYWIAFGPHGPRALPDPNEGWKVAQLVLYLIGASAVVFAALRYFARPAPKTMTKEWQEMTNEYMKACVTRPIFSVLIARLDAAMGTFLPTANTIFVTGTKDGGYYGGIFRRIHRKRYGTEQVIRKEAIRRRRRIEDIVESCIAINHHSTWDEDFFSLHTNPERERADSSPWTMHGEL